MFRDIYLKEHIILDTKTGKKKARKKSMGIEPISDEQKKFIEQYSIRLLLEQNKVNKDEIIVYTKISMNYAVQYGLCYITLVFHPCSLAKRHYYQNEETDKIKSVFQEIIVWETTETKTYLSRAQLELIIKHFRLLESEV